MILAVCLNPAWDITYELPHLRSGASHRVHSVHARAGGKGVNVARVLTQLGQQVLLMGLLGGPTGDRIADDLDRAGIPHAMTRLGDESRHTVTVVDGHGATVLNEAGPSVCPATWSEFCTAVAGRLSEGDVIVLSGSLPHGLRDDAYAQLTDLGHDVGARVIVDADGPALGHALASGPDVVKPNADEAAELLGIPTHAPDEAIVAARALVTRGAGVAVISRGADALVTVVGERTYTVDPPTLTRGNPTGAGDSLTALIADGVARGRSWPETLTTAVAAAAATVASAQAGTFDAALADRLRHHISFEEH